MKLRKLFWMAIVLLPLLACNDPDTIAETETKLQFIIPLNSVQSQTKATAETYSFSGFTTFCLANKDNARNCPDNILRVMPGSGSVLTFLNVSGDISELKMEWGFASGGSGSYSMQGEIDLMLPEELPDNGSVSVNLDEVLAPLISQIDSNPKSYIKLLIKGNTDFEFTSIAQMEIPIIVEHEVLPVRFTL
ncbi:hypothetical protein OU798_13870 [Prolixibacteraceae bacterium Z1-6]|uniref:Lipoprotein n=1 Tax=Draconibacterium aestuarii TaxID=2998507 RepID=A0A9X3J5D1_9BACT|nr:hypothetical protein [Prolixibacteraceae bacterium Z1-6]